MYNEIIFLCHISSLIACVRIKLKFLIDINKAQGNIKQK